MKEAKIVFIECFIKHLLKNEHELSDGYKYYNDNYDLGVNNVLTQIASDIFDDFSKSEKENSSTFTTYDTTNGNCGLCGSLFCRGQCFK